MYHGLVLRNVSRGCLSLESVSPLCDAMRKWTDPEAVKERDILLGEDDAASWDVRRVHAILVRRYKEAYANLEETEMKTFGINSFFVAGDKMCNDSKSNWYYRHYQFTKSRRVREVSQYG